MYASLMWGEINVGLLCESHDWGIAVPLFGEWPINVHNNKNTVFFIVSLQTNMQRLCTNITHTVSPPAQGAEQSERTTPQL